MVADSAKSAWDGNAILSEGFKEMEAAACSTMFAESAKSERCEPGCMVWEAAWRGAEKTIRETEQAAITGAGLVADPRRLLLRARLEKHRAYDALREAIDSCWGSGGPR